MQSVDPIPNTDLDAERAVLAACVYDPSCLADALSACPPAGYWDHTHRCVLEALEWLYGKSKSLDQTEVVRAVAGRHGMDVARQAIDVLMELASWPAVADVRVHAQRVRECWEARCLALALKQAGKLVEAGKTDEAVAVVRGELDRERVLGSRLLTEGQVLSAGLASVTRSRVGVYCTSGFRRIDDLTGGISEGCNWVFGAKRNFGKSAYGLRLFEENTKRGMNPLIVAFEDDEALYGKRLLSVRGSVPLKHLRGRWVRREMLEVITNEVEQAGPGPMILDARGRMIEDVARDVSYLIRSKGVKLVVWDYLQAAKCREKFGDQERLRVRYIAEQMRLTTQVPRVAGIVLSQVTTMNGKQYPDADSIRDCRDVSDAAEVVILGFALQEHATIRIDESEKDFDEGTRIMFLSKNKDGPTDLRIPVDWDTDLATFLADSREADDEFQDVAEEIYP